MQAASQVLVRPGYRPRTLAKIAHRINVTNLNIARKIVRSWGLHKKEDVTVVEAYPGNGILTRAILELPNVRKVLPMDHEPQMILPDVKAILDQDPRVHFVQGDPYRWEAFSDFIDQGHLSHVPKVSWEQEQNKLFLACQMPITGAGEQLLAQWLLMITTRSWLYGFGRMSMGLLLSENLRARLAAPMGSALRRKMAVILAALVECKTTMPADLLPVNQFEQMWTKGKTRYAPISAAVFTPHVEQTMQGERFEAFEFLAKALFIHSNTPWSKSIKYAAPGAEILTQKVRDAGHPVDPDKTPEQLTVLEWLWITDAFIAWPFRPKALFDIDEKEREGAAKYRVSL